MGTVLITLWVYVGSGAGEGLGLVGEIVAVGAWVAGFDDLAGVVGEGGTGTRPGQITWPVGPAVGVAVTYFAGHLGIRLVSTSVLLDTV